MGSSSNLDLTFVISGEPSGAIQAVQAAKQSVADAERELNAQQEQGLQLARVARAETAAYAEAAEHAAMEARQQQEELNKTLISSHNSVHLLAEEMGIHLPRAVIAGIAELLPSIGSMGGAMLGVFAVETIYSWGKAGVEAIKEMQGETKELKSEWDSIIREQEQLLTHPKTLAEGQRDLEESSRRLTELSKKAEKIRAEMATAPSAIVQGAVSALTFGLAKGRESVESLASDLNEVTAEEAKWQERQKQQLDAVAQMEDAAHKEAERAAKEAAERLERHAEATRERINLFNQQMIEEGVRWGKQLKKVLGTEVLDNTTFLAALQRRNKGIADAGNALTPFITEFHQLTEEERAQLPFTISTTNQMAMLTQRLREQHQQVVEGNLPAMRKINLAYEHNIDIARREVAEMAKAYEEKKATLADYEGALTQEAQVEAAAAKAREDAVKAAHMQELEQAGQVAAGIAGLIGGRRAQAGVEAAFEVAEGAKALAEGIWPPNPQAILAASQHFVAAAEYAKIAGTSSHRSGATGGVGGSFSDRGGRLGSGAGDRAGHPPPDTLAPGAAGGGGRFGTLHVVMMGDHEAGQYFAGILNRAVGNGVQLTSTSSMRGSPVGH